jgi:hypothetical protein
MPYTMQITRRDPSCFLFLIDQSRSMEEPFRGESGISKARKLADSINTLLYELILRCTKSQAEGVRHYYDVGVLGYGREVRSVLSGPLAGRDLVPIPDLAEHPARVEAVRQTVDDGSGRQVEEITTFPVWLEALADNGTPMADALALAYAVLEPWVTEHPESFPPLVVNITDGEPDPGTDPLGPAQLIQDLRTRDGNALLFNVHLSGEAASPVLYPESAEGLPDPFAALLFEMSSPLTLHMRAEAQKEGYAVGDQSRGFVFQAGGVELIRFLYIGTRRTEMR